MPFAEVRGRRIHYETHGEGDTVLLLHHGFAGSKMWDAVYPGLVDAGYRVVLYDRRGFGRSDAGADFDRFYVSDEFRRENVTDLARLTETLDLPPFHIIGHCEGGVVGVYFAGRFPHMVRSLTTSSTMCFSTMPLPEFNRLKFPKSFDELAPAMQEKFVRWHGEDRAGPLYEMARTRGGAYGSGMFDLRPALPFVRCPALVLYPDRSALFEVEQGAALYRGLPKGELAVIPRCGHNTYEQKPQDYLRHALDFLNRVAGEAGTADIDFSMTCAAPAPTEPGPAGPRGQGRNP
jgi:pimeloyl-ACP methyl ester carboxylesterase